MSLVRQLTARRDVAQISVQKAGFSLALKRRHRRSEAR
jgi:hypothetical protein